MKDPVMRNDDLAVKLKQLTLSRQKKKTNFEIHYCVLLTFLDGILKCGRGDSALPLHLSKHCAQYYRQELTHFT